jgi:hypothetical protein
MIDAQPVAIAPTGALPANEPDPVAVAPDSGTSASNEYERP